jgi:hypothetical protein
MALWGTFQIQIAAELKADVGPRASSDIDIDIDADVNIDLSCSLPPASMSSFIENKGK